MNEPINKRAGTETRWTSVYYSCINYPRIDLRAGVVHIYVTERFLRDFRTINNVCGLVTGFLLFPLATTFRDVRPSTPDRRSHALAVSFYTELEF